MKSSAASARFRGAAILFSARSFNSFVSLVFTLLAGRILTIEDHGIFTQSLARIVIAQALTEAGLQFSLVRFLAPAFRRDDKSELSGIIRASLQLKFYATLLTAVLSILIISVFISFSLFGSSDWTVASIFSTHPDGLTFMWLIFLGGFGMSILSYLESVLIARESYVRLSFWLPSVGLIRLSLLAYFIFFGYGEIRSEHVVYAFALGPFLSAAVFFIFFPASFFFEKVDVAIWTPWVKKLFNYNLWILAAAFMSIISDWMEIHLLRDATDRGLYSAARMPLQGFVIVLATMQAIILPRFAGLTTRAEYKAIFKKLYFYIFLLIGLLLPALGFFIWFIPWWYGSVYTPAVIVFVILYPGFLLRLCFAPLGVALYALDQPKLIAVEAALRMISGLILNTILIPLFGITGAAFAGLVSQSTGWIFLLYCYYRFFNNKEFPLQSKKSGI